MKNMKKLDNLDNKIIECLKKGEQSQTGLFRETFAREGQNGWKNRLKDLKDKKIINMKRVGTKQFKITLTERLKKKRNI